MKPPGRLPIAARIRVGVRRISKKKARTNQLYKYEVPQLRISNLTLLDAGFHPGDFVVLTIPKPGFLVVMRDPDQRETKDFLKRKRRASKLIRAKRAAARPKRTLPIVVLSEPEPSPPAE